MADIPLVWPSCESGAVSGLCARQRHEKGPRPGLALPATEATSTSKATAGKRSQALGVTEARQARR